jgi:hypothetical protein
MVATENYLYDLPDELHSLIYKKLFKETLSVISDMRETQDNYNKLVAYIKENHYRNYNPEVKRAIWCIYNCREVGDPYYKYYQYYADDTTDFLRLNKMKMTAHERKYSTIKYMEFAMFPIIEDRVKNVLEEYARGLLSGTDTNPIPIKTLLLCNQKIRVEFKDTHRFTCCIDIYNSILETYNFIAEVLFANNLDDIMDLRIWFEYNSFLNGFSIRDGSDGDGDTICTDFYM